MNIGFMKVQIYQCRILLPFLIVGFAQGMSDGAEDDFAEIKPVEVFPPRFTISSLSFDESIFGDGPVTPQQRITSQVEAKIRETVKTYNLNENQRDKLVLAASVDVKRFFTKADELREKYEESRGLPAGLNDMVSISREAMTLRIGLLGSGSYFDKVLKTNLMATSSQIAQDLKMTFDNLPADALGPDNDAP